MRKYRIAWLLVSAAVLLCGLWGGGRLAPVLLFPLLLLPALSFLYLKLSVKGLTFTLRGNHDHCRSGQQMEMRFRLHYSLLPPAGMLLAELVCENHVFATSEERLCLLEPGRGREQEYALSLDTSLCGGMKVRVSELRCYDLFRLFSCGLQAGEEFGCMVYPFELQMYVTLNRNREREQPGDIYDGRRSGTDVSEVFGLREYQEGDPLSGVHWKLSGKMKKLIVREFGRPVNYHTLILLAPAFRYGEKEVSGRVVSGVFDLGISLSLALLNQNIAHFVGYLYGNELKCVPVDSPRGYEEMLRGLMNTPAQKNGDEVLLSFLERQAYRQYTKVVYVAGAVNGTAAENLSVLADLTVLLAAEGPSGYLSGRGGYAVVGVSMEGMREKEHVIPL